jgi:hypothetical protein
VLDPSEVKLPARLSAEQKADFFARFNKPQFANLFAEDPKAPPPTPLVELRLETGAAEPVSLPQRRYSQAEWDMIREEVDKLKKRLLVEQSSSPWAAPIVCVAKKAGPGQEKSLRMCVDYRELNKRLIGDAGGIGCQDAVMDRLAGCMYFTTLDCASGFFQIPIAAEDRHKTAFRTPWGELLQYRVAPFGIKTLPSIYTRLMLTALGSTIGNFVFVYMDDIIVASKSWTEHLDHLEAVFERLVAAGISLNLGKSAFCQSSVQYLGRIFSRHGSRVDPDKVKAILELAEPTTKGDLRTFIGMVQYHSDYIYGLAEIMEPLTRLVSQQYSMDDWGDEQRQAFDVAKTALTNAPVLAYPDSALPYILYVDVSKIAIGGTLAQRRRDGAIVVVAYYNKKLSPTQAAYAATERECLGVVECVKHYRPFLYGTRYTMVVDAIALKWLFSVRATNDKLQRWSLLLQDQDVTIQHRSGLSHGIADGPSRLMTSLQRSTDATDVMEEWPEFSQVAYIGAVTTDQLGGVKMCSVGVLDDDGYIIDSAGGRCVTVRQLIASVSHEEYAGGGGRGDRLE